MPEVRKEAKTYIVRRFCDKCKKGEMLPINLSLYLATYPPQYAHKCNVYGIVENYNCIYPRSEVVEVGNNE